MKEDEQYYFHFRVLVNNEPASEIWGPKMKRNWVTWKLSEYCVALASDGDVTVERNINGEWREANDWAAKFAN